jgi:hypothetical protein
MIKLRDIIFLAIGYFALPLIIATVLGFFNKGE